MSENNKEKTKLEDISQVFKGMSDIIGIVNTDLGKTFENMSKISKAASDIKESATFKTLNESFENTKAKCEMLRKELGKMFVDMQELLRDFGRTFANAGLGGAFDVLSSKAKGLGEDIKGALKSIKSNPFDALSKSLSTFGTAVAGIFTVGIAGGIALAATAIAGFAACFKHLMETNEEFNDKVTELWSNVTEAFQPAIDAFGELFACLVTGRETVDTEGNAIVESFLTVTTVITEALAVVVGSIAEVISGVAQFIKDIVFTTAGETEGKTVTTWQVITDAIGNAWELLKEIFGAGAEVISAIWNAVGDEIVVVFAAVWETVADLLDGAVDLINGVMDIVVGIFTRDGDKIKEGFDGVVEGIKDAVSGIVGFFGDIWNVIKGQFTSIAVTIADGVSGAFKSVVNKILNYAGGVINGFVRAINGDAYHKQVLKRVQGIMGE